LTSTLTLAQIGRDAVTVTTTHSAAAGSSTVYVWSLTSQCVVLVLSSDQFIK